MITRREWVVGMGMVAGAAVGRRSVFGESAEVSTSDTQPEPPLLLSEFEPRSMLQVAESHVPRARFPVIDFHTHITQSSWSKNGVALAAERVSLGSPHELVAVMNRKNIRRMVNLTGWVRAGPLQNNVGGRTAYPGR